MALVPIAFKDDQGNEVIKNVLYLGKTVAVPIPRRMVIDGVKYPDFADQDGQEVDMYVYIRFIDMLDDTNAIVEVNITPKRELIKETPKTYSLNYYAVPITKKVPLTPRLWNVFEEDLVDANLIDWEDIFAEDETEEEFDISTLE